MSANNNNEGQMVMFRLADQNYGVGIDSVYEVIRMEKVTKVPETPDFVEGVISLRGQSIPVVDLARRLGFAKSEETAQSRIIVMDVGGTTAGFIVDEVLEVIHVADTEIQPPPQTLTSIRSDYLTGIALLEGAMVIILDMSNLLQQYETDSLIAAQEKLEVM